jgi:hypothetical protein
MGAASLLRKVTVSVQSPELWELWETRSVSGEFSKGCGKEGKWFLIFPPFP